MDGGDLARRTPSGASRRVAHAATVALRWPSRAVPANRAGALALRAVFRVALPFAVPARGVVATPVRGGEWVVPAGGDGHATRHAGDAAILYLHGSAYVCSSPRAHRGIVGLVARACGAPAFAARYRRAPEHRFPAAADDVLAAWRRLLAEGHAPDRIVVAGDSAGGQLALGLALTLAAAGEPQPAGLLLLSPLLDPTFALGRARDRVARDPFFTAGALARLVGAYVDGAVRDPRVAPLHAPAEQLAALAPMLLQVGGRELLADEAQRFSARVAEAGGDCALQVWPGQIHVFQAQAGVLREARAALAEAGRFADGVLGRAGAAATSTRPDRRWADLSQAGGAGATCAGPALSS